METISEVSENFTRAKQFIIYAMCKIDLLKMKRSNGIGLLEFSIGKVLKKYGK